MKNIKIFSIISCSAIIFFNIITLLTENHNIFLKAFLFLLTILNGAALFYFFKIDIRKHFKGELDILVKDIIESYKGKSNVNINHRFFCDTCNCDINEEDIHCYGCNSCIRNKDHHCSWFDTCINQENFTSFSVFIYTGLFLTTNLSILYFKKLQVWKCNFLTLTLFSILFCYMFFKTIFFVFLTLHNLLLSYIKIKSNEWQEYKFSEADEYARLMIF